MGRRRGRHRAKSRRGVWILRVAVVFVVCGGIAAALAVFGPDYLDRSSARADERFVAAVHAQGRTVPSGQDQALVIQAAHKLCESRVDGTSVSRRRASALTADEIDAVRRTFGDDASAFVKVAKRSYCPLQPMS